MIIYLAGKIKEWDWRYRYVNGLENACYEINMSLEMDWPILRSSIAEHHSYSGPYALGGEHGSNAYGYGHGWGNHDQIDHGNHCPWTETRDHIVKCCRDAMAQCDIIFAWIDDLTAFGTIFELGYAVANKIPVFLAMPEDLYTELWFVVQFIENAPNSICIPEEKVDDAFKKFISRIEKKRLQSERMQKIESPIELQFYKEITQRVSSIEPQWEIVYEGHKYRADFAIPEKKIAIEIDGHDYHKTKEQRTNDARRERDFQKAGWKVIRFTGSEIFKNVQQCCNDVYKLVYIEELK